MLTLINFYLICYYSIHILKTISTSSTKNSYDLPRVNFVQCTLTIENHPEHTHHAAIYSYTVHAVAATIAIPCMFHRQRLRHFLQQGLCEWMLCWRGRSYQRISHNRTWGVAEGGHWIHLHRLCTKQFVLKNISTVHALMYYCYIEENCVKFLIKYWHCL